MRILITNDDGIRAPGIKALADAAIARGHQVLISAPSAQCSANSQHITLDKPLLVHPVPWENAEAYAVDGTPSDCARIGAMLSKEKVDVCISGINRGENTGAGIYYSGTVAAARDAAMLYIPAIAVSLMFGGTEEGLKRIAAFAIEKAEEFATRPFPRCGVLNINAPKGDPSAWKEPVVCPISSAYFLDGYVRRESPHGQMYFWLGYEEGDNKDALHMEKHPEGSDSDMLAKGHITLSMLTEYATRNDMI
jgi:5'-nucleotidase